MSKESIPSNHMEIYWHDYAGSMGKTPIVNASLTEKASVIGRTGLMLLSCGTGAWRVRSSMNTIATKLGITCTVNIGLMSIDYTCFDGHDCFSQSLCLTNTGVNTSKLNRLEHFVIDFEKKGENMTGEELHAHLDEIEKLHGLYSPVALGFAAALACSAFTFLLGGGPVEMLLAFLGAGVGNFLRCKLAKHHFTLFLCIVSSVAAACLVYTGMLRVAEEIFNISLQHQAGYICSMLFIIPGFPFITSGIDLAKLDMRSGIERLVYALVIIIVATITAWIMALLLNLKPIDFPVLKMSVGLHLFLRLIMSFCGVFGFSIMFNSPVVLAAAAFIGAFCAGILASALKNRVGYPRISITVPSIVIMVPGLYLYRAVYNLGIMSLVTSASWFASAMLIILALPLGLIFARILTDKTFRYCT